MPYKPKGICLVPGCPNRTEPGRSYCRVHQNRNRPKDLRPSSYARGYDRVWRGVRGAFLRAHRECAMCGKPATDVHHIKPLSQGGTHDWDNLMPLCHSCHSKVTGGDKGKGGGLVNI